MAAGYAKFAIGKGLQVDIETAMSIESDMFGLCCATEDKNEGLGAFVEERKPQFKNR
jgi:enoyl-CoA hydratase